MATKTRKVAKRASARHVAMVSRNATPPATNIPAPTYPIAVSRNQGALAPPPLADRYPLIVGQRLNATYLSSVFRLGITGYRQQFVDALNELLEMDGHAYSVVSKRLFSVANGRVELLPAILPADHPDTEAAKDLCDFVRIEIGKIPDFAAACAYLCWGIFYGITAMEKFFSRDADGWHITRLQFIHSRRLAFPDPQSRDLYIWDQGQVFGWGSGWGDAPTNATIFGLRVADYPGKFVVHAPQLRGDYPERDGIGRQMAIWSLFKRAGVRGAMTYLERFAVGFMDVTWSRTADGKPDEANAEDIETAKQIAAELSSGSDSFGAHPNTVAINAKSFDGGSSAKITWDKWVEICNAEQSKIALGGTLGTEVGHAGGNRALGEVQERSEADIEQFDATMVSETIRRDIVMDIVRLNRPSQVHLCPRVVTHVHADPSPKLLADVASTLAKAGAPVDADKVADQVGIALVPNESGKPRRLFNSDVLDPSLVDPELMSEEAKQQQADAAKADQDAAMAKATAPQIAPGAPPDGKKLPAGAPPQKKKTKPKTAQETAR